MEKCFPFGWPQEAHSTNFPSFGKGSLIHPWPSLSLSAEEVAEAKAMATSKSHSQAEKRRRERINSHLSTLRQLIPSSHKLDKAALLGRVIDHVKDLKRKAFEVEGGFTMPTEIDEVTVECGGTGGQNSSGSNSKETHFIRASICCDDRPELFNDLVEALHGLRLRAIRADMATLGGRMRNVLILCTRDGEENVCLSSLKDSVQAVLGGVASRMSSSTTLSSKRQRALSLY
ncbi:transcription factor AIG1-like [Tasmannia lanceolata]|uniref:transcription factor AIG1-like n=1 Tax=Tasmannia lanceolata TaxID=3420 RepID=UPI0040643994